MSFVAFDHPAETRVTAYDKAAELQRELGHGSVMQRRYVSKAE